MDGLEWKFPLIDIEVPHILGTAPKKWYDDDIYIYVCV